MPLSHARWLFFDVGETLVSETKAWQERIRQMVRAFAERGLAVSASTIEQAFEEASAEFAPRLIARVVERFAARADDRAFVLKRAPYRGELEEPQPEAYKVLATLAGTYRIGVIANQSAGTEARLAQHGLASFISICLGSADVGLAKPDPAIFRLALKRAGCEPHQAVMVGDRIDNDIRPAKALGWRTIRVLQGFAKAQSPRGPDEEPDFTVSSLKDIVSLLR
ncbi:MAG: HAD family hydrolase [Armatimonadota bacterium]|nr:MAG: HAD family hydrolase [Armatimonadota bacterium]